MPSKPEQPTQPSEIAEPADDDIQEEGQILSSEEWLSLREMQMPKMPSEPQQPTQPSEIAEPSDDDIQEEEQILSIEEYLSIRGMPPKPQQPTLPSEIPSDEEPSDIQEEEQILCIEHLMTEMPKIPSEIKQPEIAEPKPMAPETSSEVVAVPSKLEVEDSSKLTLRIVKIGDFGEKVVFDWSDMPKMKSWKSLGPPSIWDCIFSFMFGIFIGGCGLLSGFVVTAASVVNLAKMGWSCACSPFKKAVTWFKTRSA
jgi:hypothetical protein